MSKIKFIKELPPYLKTMNQESLSFKYPFDLSLYDHELIFDEKIRGRYIDHKIIVDEEILEIIDDENHCYG